jgi:hypothetical protein
VERQRQLAAAERWVIDRTTRSTLALRLQRAVVLRSLGAHLGRLANIDLMVRCQLGPDHNKHHWAARKRALTAESSSRWAGAITKRSNDVWATAWQSQARYAASLRRAIRTLEQRLVRPVGSHGTRRTMAGYRSQAERHEKQRRLQILRARLDRLDAELHMGHLNIVRGGHRLLSARHNLDTAKLSEAEWRQRWEATRWFLQANGEADACWGNATIRVHPTGEVDLALPASLGHLANRPRRRYRLSCLAQFQHRGEDWAAQMAVGAVAYAIWFSPERRRWYLDASWTKAPSPPVTLENATDNGVVAVHFNADHLACWILDGAGNPMGKPSRIPLDLAGSSLRRDAQLRHAVSRLIRTARAANVDAIAIEDLGFGETTRSRECHGRNRRFRHLVSSFPTSAFRRRLIIMSARAGLAVVAVDPALYVEVGTATLAAAAVDRAAADHSTRGGGRGDWKTQPWASCPASARCDRPAPEGCGEESYRPGPAACTRLSGNSPARRRPGSAVAQRT